jgi:hypothetical protein
MYSIQAHACLQLAYAHARLGQDSASSYLRVYSMRSDILHTSAPSWGVHLCTLTIYMVSTQAADPCCCLLPSYDNKQYRPAPRCRLHHATVTAAAFTSASAAAQCLATDVSVALWQLMHQLRRILCPLLMQMYRQHMLPAGS